ncbi:MAG: sigma-70 family RNA polymerase sigma factor [Deltaproteobacteria bacterium]|nr:sigma-70 family RNA polymerase sigma factor [Deltaproteobacteria bacterium]
MDAAARRTLQDNLRRLRDGDRAAARPVFDALWPPCSALARSQLQNDDDAKDAAQVALMRLFREVAGFDDARSGLGWGLALVTWECRTIRKKRSRSRAVPLHEGVDVAGPADLLGELVRAEDVARVARAFVDLDEGDRETLRALLDGDAAGHPTLRKRRQRALDRLRALVRPTAAPGEPHV